MCCYLFTVWRLTAALLFAVVLIAAAVGQGPRGSLRSITVLTEPNATIWVDGVLYGVTDDAGRLAIASVLPGIRKLRVRAAGFSEIERALPATSRGEISIKLTKTTDEAELAFQSAEALAGVDREKAIAEYQRAIKLRPKYAEPFIALARAYAARGDIENALKAMQSAKRLKPGNAEVSAIEARLMKDTGEEERAIAVFKRAITEGRGFQPEAYTGLGLLYKDRAEQAASTADLEAETSNYNEAARNLAVAVKQLGSAPDAIVVIQLLGLIYERQKKFKEAIALYEDFLKIFPGSSEASAVESFIVQIKK